MNRYYKIAKWAFLILLVANTSVLAYKWTKPVASAKKVIDVGDIFQDEKRDVEIQVDNLGVRPLAVKAVQGGCSCLQVKEITNHGSFTTIVLTLDPSVVRAGDGHSAAIIKTNDPSNELLKVRVAFNVKTHLELSKSRIEILTQPGFKNSAEPFIWHGRVEIKSDTTLEGLEIIGCDTSLSGAITKLGDKAAVLELEMKLTKFVGEFEKRLILQSGSHKAPLDVVAIWR